MKRERKGEASMSEFAWERGKEYKKIVYETIDGLARITINRPERRNA